MPCGVAQLCTSSATIVLVDVSQTSVAARSIRRRDVSSPMSAPDPLASSTA